MGYLVSFCWICLRFYKHKDELNLISRENTTAVVELGDCMFCAMSCVITERSVLKGGKKSYLRNILKLA